MKKIFTLLGGVLSVYFMVQNLQAQTNINLVGHLPYNQTLSDIWGYTDGSSGIEYAIVGLENGTSIVSLDDPSNPTEVAYIPGASTIWRDMKVWNDFAYVTNEGGGGLLIIDMSNLPTSIETYTWDGTDDTNYNVNFETAHNIFIDNKGFAYLLGSNTFGSVTVGGATILDLNIDPINPPIVGMYEERYIHDAYARNDTLWSAEIYEGIISVVDVSNKATPNVIGNQSTPNDFAHNCWLSDDGDYLFTTDEVSNGYLGAYNVDDVSNIYEVDRIQSSPGEEVIPHNTFYHNGFLVTSYYRDGVTIHDASNPNALVEIGNYDTSPNYSGNGFNGCWGVFPYFQSGLIIASDIEEGLYVLQPTYVHAAYLQGLVLDAENNNPIYNATITIISNNGETIGQTNLNGLYDIGAGVNGTVTIIIEAPGYEPITYTDINLVSGQSLTLDATLQALPSFSFNGTIIDAITSLPIPNATVIVSDADFSFNLNTDANGNFLINSIVSNTYDVAAGSWGYQSQVIPSITLNEDNSNLILSLIPGYYDDFYFDFGWSVNNETFGGNNSGEWELGVPNGTDYYGIPANTGVDVATDLGEQCYVTGNGGGGVGSDDVDQLITTLTSPVFDLSNYNEPRISYYRWFFTDGGQGDPLDDYLFITLTNGIETVNIETVAPNSPDLAQWVFNDIKVSDFITPTANMQISFETSDLPGTGHLVEAAVDAFTAYDANPIVGIGITNTLTTLEVQTYPNPFSTYTNLHISNYNKFITEYGTLNLQIFDVLGRCVHTQTITQATTTINKGNKADGLYFYTLSSVEKTLFKGNLFIQK